jgi:hypothetical protein
MMATVAGLQGLLVMFVTTFTSQHLLDADGPEGD